MPKMDGTYTVLQVINENKKVLFKKSNDQVDKDNKITEWKKILRVSQMLNVIPNNKDYTFLRDVFWENLKKSAIKRRDEKMKGKSVPLTPADLIIIQILADDDSPKEPKNTEIITFPTKKILKSMNRFENGHVNGKDTEYDSKQKKIKKGEESNMEDDTSENTYDEQLQTERRLEIEFLELKTYRLKLELLELEQKLKLEPSEFTRKIKIDNKIPKNDVLCDTMEGNE